MCMYVCVGKAVAKVLERNFHAESESEKRQKNCQKKEIISENMEYMGIRIT